MAILAGPGALRADIVVKFLRASHVASTCLLKAVCESEVVVLEEDMETANFPV